MTNKVVTRELYKGYGILVKDRKDGMYTGVVTKPTGGSKRRFVAESCLLCVSYCEDYIEGVLNE